MMISVSDREENIVEKGENVGYQQLPMFSKALYCRAMETRDFMGKV